jgi:hypothetical protein
MKLFVNLMMVLALCAITAHVPASGPITLSKVIVALKPDKDPDAMIAERAQLSEYLSKQGVLGLGFYSLGYLGKFL